MSSLDWIDTLHYHVSRKSRITVLTGAGISAESGIPTFRGPEGYWTVGSRAYHPQEMATCAMFRQRPDDVWQWYLHRATVCHAAAPHPGHRAIAAMETLVGDRFTMITQNVDGLHQRALQESGLSGLVEIIELHGSIFRDKCFDEDVVVEAPAPGDGVPPRRVGQQRKPLVLGRKDLRLTDNPAWAAATAPLLRYWTVSP